MKLDNKYKLKKYITIENLLCIFIILCPILDMASFIFRNYFSTNFSISTFVRPIIPIIAIIYIFFKDKLKLQMILVFLFYGLYAALHLYLFNNIRTDCAYGNVVRETQYLINYTFMIMNLFVYLYFFAFKNRKKEIKDEEKGKSINKLKISILISLTIYIISMFIAIITGTSSATYIEEGIGYKGWFESGNSIGTIMILLLFVVMPMLSSKNNVKIRIWALVIIILTGVYLTTLLGTRTGLIGFSIVVISYIFLEIFYNILHNKKLNKKILMIGVFIFIIMSIIIVIFGSMTFIRRKNIKNQADLVYDESIGTTSHITGDLLNIVNQIKAGTLEDKYMSEAMKKSLLELYDYANENNISNTDRRVIQFIYHSNLVKNQNNIPMLILGNGYMSHYYELIFEMEVLAFLYNFGILGFFIYFIPFFIIAIAGIYKCFTKIKKVSVEFMMITIACSLAIILSLLSGYTFFNSSTMMIIIVLSSILINSIQDLEDNEMKIYER